MLDFAEIPTFELLQQWKVDAKDSVALQQRATREATGWLRNLSIEDNGKDVSPVLRTVQVTVQDGAGGMPIMRVTLTLSMALQAGAVEYTDANYPGRTGWKEIVIRQGRGVNIVRASNGNRDLSNALSQYPADASILPPQDLRATLEWKRDAAPSIVKPPPPDVVVASKPAAQPESTIRPFSAQQPTAPGTVVKGDFLSRMLQTREIGLGLILIGIAVAFGLGAMHALSPGHGKTIVAAYLVGSRGTARHAMFLGATVTLTHTLSVFLLGLGVLLFEQYVVPDRIIPWLGAISGLSIVAVGIWLLYQRGKSLLPAGDHGHHHSHHHGHHHEHAHDHGHGMHVHTHGGHAHTHAAPTKMSLGSLFALGVSGGLVPCPSALVLMLSAIALGHAGLGLILLVGFSSGLALVLMGIGILVIYAKHLIPDKPGVSSHPFFRLVPVFSAVVVVCLGLGMTAVSMGWLQAVRLRL